MIEQAMVFALGFLLAGLVALAFAPAFWRRALRLTRRRLEAQVPLSVDEILADRDHLRAEFAVERCRLEKHVAQVMEAHTADRAELGRRASELASLNETLAVQAEEIRAQAEALAKAEQEIASLSNERGALNAALYDADGLTHSKLEELAHLSQKHQALSALADERLAGHASADARAAGLELRLGDLSRTLVEAEKRFTERTAHAARLNDALVAAQRNLETLEGNYTILQQKLDAQNARAAELAKERDDLHRQQEEKLQIEHDEAEKARVAERDLRKKYDALSAEFTALESALDTARRRCTSLEAELRALPRTPGQQEPASDAAANAALRQDVREIGSAIVRLTRGAEGPPNLASPEAQDADSLEVTNQTGT